jgi:hypothetical protein
MADFFLQLPLDERREALGVAAAASGRPMHLLDKDVWVVWVLEVLFQAPFATHLVFKGGSSLSKAYQIIRRFSEDVDLTYDIRVLAPDLVGVEAEPLPQNRSQEKRWTKEIRTRLPLWINDQVVPLISRALSEQRLSARLSAEGDHLPGVVFPAANPRVMRPERTFWEKATAIHVFCVQGEFRGGNRFARHWHDITRLDRAGIVKTAIADRALSLAVARHKAIFFAEKDSDGAAIDYQAAVTGALQLVPHDDALESLSLDYAEMVEDGLLFDDAEPFDELLDHCRELQERANRMN